MASVIQYMDCITKKKKKSLHFDYMEMNTQPWATQVEKPKTAPNM